MFKKICYTLGLAVFFLLVVLSIKNANLSGFIDMVENKTFDLRQTIMVNSGVKKASEDIVIVVVDDASYEYILDNYGEWPLPRDIYAKIVDYIETQSPRIVAFDLMFVKSLKSANQADKALADLFKKYGNVYTAMNLDNQSEDLRTPPKLPEALVVNVKNYSNDVNFDALTFTNCRAIIDDILNYSSNIGFINVSRSDDGILRTMPVFVKYQDKFYPQLALKVGMEYLRQVEGINVDNFEIDANSVLSFGGRNILLQKDGSAILNWYGPAGTYTQIPLYKLIKAVNHEQTDLDYNFHNKIVYFGTTAASLFDIKSVPTDKIYPGVEIQATYVNNLIDNNFISKVERFSTIVISLILAFIIGTIVLRSKSAVYAALVSLGIYFIYVLSAYYVMRFGNVWFEVIYPLIFSMLAFIGTLIVKYLIKSRDFEYQYKLATTDGLTELYNHRYFQEQMLRQVEQAKRYESNFSLIIIDIDHFKNFNDTFGHQSGDAVLRQVALTLKRSVRATDIVCRYGGEEMSIILPNIGKDEAYSTAEKICKRVAEKTYRLSGNRESNVTISLGVATYPYDGSDAAAIIESADKRLYVAKNNGRNQVG